MEGAPLWRERDSGGGGLLRVGCPGQLDVPLALGPLGGTRDTLRSPTAAMRVTVCELRNDTEGREADWVDLCAHAKDSESELVLLPEMPFHRWLAASPTADGQEWAGAVEAHDAWLERLPELGAPIVISTRPVEDNRSRFNEGYVWSRSDGVVRAVHRKRYLPDEPGFWEATWYSRGPSEFDSVEVPGARVGFAICTEMWFTGHGREYARQGVQILASPRATLRPSVDKWIAGGRAAAVVSGAFCLSSNLSGRAAGTAPDLGAWGGAGWIIEPEEGEVLGVTTAEEPFLTIDIDLAVADHAKSTYPRYVLD